MVSAGIDNPPSVRDFILEEQRENARREVARLTIANLIGEEKIRAREAEAKRIQEYEEESWNRQQKAVEYANVKTMETTPPVSWGGSPSQASTSATSKTQDFYRKHDSQGIPDEKKQGWYCSISACAINKTRTAPFSSQATLLLHQSFHRGPSEYLCSFCPSQDEAFQTARSLVR